MEKQTCTARVEKIILPTYTTGKEEYIPQFMEKRVYQGSSGRVYPYPIIESISDVKIDKEYIALFLENDYIQIMILPELGGRIHRAWDKIAKRDFVYYNETIKPALVGLVGPWISGGIEFNWPQHHRPTTFKPLDWHIENSDSKATVYISEWEKMSGQRVRAEFSLYKDSAYIEIKAFLYNTSLLPQTFLWWANPAVKGGDGHQSIFPPDVNFVCDHGKRDISRFPIATGKYYKYDYSAGVDISRYKNIPVPTSYMAWKSNYDFVGVYQQDENAGLMHVADHHVVPGKKQWTWGNADFGQAWDDNLTDESGPYIELMTGAFTDNQPDFTWLEPFEEKTFTQYFMPYRELGRIHNATKDILIKCEKNENIFNLAIFPTKKISGYAIFHNDEKIFLKEEIELDIGSVWSKTIDISVNEYCFKIVDKNNKELISYKPEKETIQSLPKPATAPLKPEYVVNIEELYYIGLHIEQYRYATSSPEIYWNEALKRDALDYRCNVAMGRLNLRRGNFSRASNYLEKALTRITMKNANPESGEASFLLGVSAEYNNNYDMAYTHYYKSIWNGSFRDKGFFALSRLAIRKCDISKAREFLDLSLAHNRLNHKARHLDILLSRLEHNDNIKFKIDNYLLEDPLSFGIIYEKMLLEGDKARSFLLEKLRGHSESFVELSLLYSACGLYEEANSILSLLENTNDPMFWFHRANISSIIKNDFSIFLDKAHSIENPTVFPNRLEDIEPLSFAIGHDSYLASYLLGCFLYDRKRREEAYDMWRLSLSYKNTAVVNRCLAIAEYQLKIDKGNISKLANTFLDNAIHLDAHEPRYLFERDQLAKKMQEHPQKRIERLDMFFDNTQKRDDLFVEYITLCNITGKFEKALSAMENRKFHPWEGGEGKVTTQWVLSHLYSGVSKIKSGDNEGAYKLFDKALNYPRNLGEGKLPGSTDNDLYFWMARCLSDDNAKDLYHKASEGTEEVGSMTYYNDFPADYIFWQGMALNKLENNPAARRKFYTLIDYAENHINDDPSIDFLSVSIPDFIVFEENLKNKNITHCCFLLGMGYLGLGDRQKASEYLRQCLTSDPNHIKANFISWCMEEFPTI